MFLSFLQKRCLEIGNRHDFLAKKFHLGDADLSNILLLYNDI